MFNAPQNLVELFQVGMDRTIPNFHNTIPRDFIQLNLGAGNKIVVPAKSLDLPEWDADTMLIPYEDGQVTTIHMYHFLEHVKDPIAVLRECERVLKPNGFCNIVVPYYRSQMAYHDLDHKHFFTEDTWKILFDTPYYGKHGEWRFEIGLNVIMGIAERNLALVTQLIKR